MDVAEPEMPTSPPTFKPPWLPRVAVRRQQHREHDQRRGSARERGYDARWEKARAQHLASHPLCVCCSANGVVEPATVLDHIVPHKGDQSLFWDPNNWQGLCEWCDKAVKRPIENRWLAEGGDAGELRLDRFVPGWRAKR